MPKPEVDPREIARLLHIITGGRVRYPRGTRGEDWWDKVVDGKVVYFVLNPATGKPERVGADGH